MRKLTKRQTNLLTLMFYVKHNYTSLCGPVQKWEESLSLCPLDQLYEKAYEATDKFADLNVLCKT